MQFRHLRTTILVAFGSLIVGVLGLVVWQTTSAIGRQAMNEIAVNTRTTQNIVEQLLRDKTEELVRGAKVLSKDIGFRESVADNAADKNFDSMADSVQNFMQRLPMDEFMVTDDWGQVLADVALAHGKDGKARFVPGQFKPGEDVTTRLKVVQEAIETPEDFTKPNVAVARDGRLMQTITGNVLAPTLYGVIWFAWYLDDEKARSIQRISGAEISFVNGDRIVSSTMQGNRLEHLKKGLKNHLRQVGKKGRGRDFDLVLEGETFRSKLVPLVAGSKFPGAYLIQFSLDEALRPLRQVRAVLLLVGLLGVGIAIAASLFIAQGITLPVRKLVLGAHEIGEGNLHVRIDVKRRDELGTLAGAFNDMVQGLEEKERMRNIMNKVVSKEVAEEMIGKDISLGGEEREVTILFSDIRGFTSISETLGAAELVFQLNEYLTHMSREVDHHKGVIDKYIGDAIMAVWGAPIRHEMDADLAVRCGLGMLRALEALNADRAGRGLPPIRIGVGVNSGVVVAGNTGSDQRLNYTVLGDEVNLASRVESLTKHYGVQLVVTERTLARLKGRFAVRELDLVTVKGQTRPVAIYEVLGEEATATEPPPGAPLTA